MTNYNDTFSVLTGGGADSLDGIAVATISDADFAFGMISGLYHPYTYNASISKASTESPYFIVPADNSSGTGAWVLGGFQGAMSHVLAKKASQSIPNSTQTVIAYDTESFDTLGEFNTSTGVFTATYAGKYKVTAQFVFTSTAWTAAKIIYAYIFKNAVVNVRGVPFYASITASYPIGIMTTCNIDLAAADTLDYRVYHNQGGAISLDANADYSFISIDRLPG